MAHFKSVIVFKLSSFLSQSDKTFGIRKIFYGTIQSLKTSLNSRRVPAFGWRFNLYAEVGHKDLNLVVFNKTDDGKWRGGEMEPVSNGDASYSIICSHLTADTGTNSQRPEKSFIYWQICDKWAWETVLCHCQGKEARKRWQESITQNFNILQCRRMVLILFAHITKGAFSVFGALATHLAFSGGGHLAPLKKHQRS